MRIAFQMFQAIDGWQSLTFEAEMANPKTRESRNHHKSREQQVRNDAPRQRQIAKVREFHHVQTCEATQGQREPVYRPRTLGTPQSFQRFEREVGGRRHLVVLSLNHRMVPGSSGAIFVIIGVYSPWYACDR
jgi:hypothetical protein